LVIVRERIFIGLGPKNIPLFLYSSLSKVGKAFFSPSPLLHRSLFSPHLIMSSNLLPQGS
jgi:hypothetical protein